jgi:alpha-beta hydrolase superfamily lysophospholipase
MSRIEFTHTTPDGQELYHQGWAPDAEPKAVLCLVHGLGEHSGRYAHVGSVLNEAGYALLGFDQRGHGKTPGKRGVTPPFERLMDDIGLVLDQAAQRFPGRPRFLYGHSMGGNWVLNYALRCQPHTGSRALTGVISTSPGLRTAFKPPAAKLFAGKILYKLAPDFVLPNGLELEGISRDEEIIRIYKSDPLVHDKMSARLGLDILQQGEWAIDHAADFPPIPLLLVHGACDRLTSAPATEEFASKAELASSQPNVTLKIWPECYHETHNDPEKAEVIGFMIDWLNAELKIEN